MRKVTNFLTKGQTTLNGAVTAGAATFVLTSGTDFDSSGRVVIYDTSLNFVDYSSKATHTLTVGGGNAINIAWATGTKVEKLYALPSDYSKARELLVNSYPYRYERLDSFPSGGQYTTFGAYILMPQQIGAQTCTLYYEKKGATIDELTDTSDVPSDYARVIIEKLKAHIYLIRRQRYDVQTALTLSEEALQYALSMDTQQISNSERTRMPLPY